MLRDDDSSDILQDRRLLGDREVVGSTELVKRLGLRGYAPGTARQLLLRGFKAANIWRSDCLVLPAGGRLYARVGFFGEESFLRELRPTLIKQRPGLARVLDALLRWEGIDIDTIKKLTAVKLDVSGGGAKHLQELAAIAEVGIGLVEDSGTGRQRLVRRQFHGKQKSIDLGLALTAEREVEQNMLRILLKHYRMQHIIAWQTPDTVRETPYNGQLFSAVGYSHLRPLVRTHEGKRSACPVVFDVIARPAEEFDVAGFVERIYRAGYHTRSRLRILGVIAAPSFSPAAFKAASIAGLSIVSFGQVFGPAALEALTAIKELTREVKEVSTTTKNREKVEVAATKRFTDSLIALKNNPLVSDLCGIGLETYAVACLRSDGFDDVSSNLRVPFHKEGVKTTRDVDVSGHRNRVWHAIECKALRRDVELREEYVKYFFCETLPAFLLSVGKDNIDTCHAEIWTTGLVPPEIIAYLGRLKFDKRVKPAIKSKREIPVPHAIKSLGRILDVISEI